MGKWVGFCSRYGGFGNFLEDKEKGLVRLGR